MAEGVLVLVENTLNVEEPYSNFPKTGTESTSVYDEVLHLYQNLWRFDRSHFKATIMQSRYVEAWTSRMI